jgi:predicted amidohydrolase YtcJ
MRKSHRIPLLADHHSHPSVYAAMYGCLDLRNVHDKRRALELIRHRDEEIVFVLGWNNSLYGFHRDDLEALPPTFVCDAALHGFLVNDAARERLSEGYPEVIANIEDEAWVERNLHKIIKLIVGVRGCGVDDLTAFYDGILNAGVWSAEEMLLANREMLDAFEEADLLHRTRIWADPDTYLALDQDARAKVHGIKLFADGALAARTAAISEPFLSGEWGFLLHTDEELGGLIRSFSAEGKSVAVHAVGDRATDQILRVMEDERAGCSSPSVRIEHCAFLTVGQAERAKSADITLSVQPNFSIESVDYRDRLSEEWCARNHPFRMLIDKAGFVPGEDLVFGSGGVPHGVEFGLQMSLFPPYSSQRLTLEEFVAGYCLPDLSRGHIDVEIDGEERTVTVKAISIGA